MTAWTAALTTRLEQAGTDAGQKFHWLDVPAGTVAPYVVLSVPSDPRPQHLKGYDGARVSRWIRGGWR